MAVDSAAMEGVVVTEAPVPLKGCAPSPGITAFQEYTKSAGSKLSSISRPSTVNVISSPEQAFSATARMPPTSVLSKISTVCVTVSMQPKLSTTVRTKSALSAMSVTEFTVNRPLGSSNAKLLISKLFDPSELPQVHVKPPLPVPPTRVASSWLPLATVPSQMALGTVLVVETVMASISGFPTTSNSRS